MCMMVVAPVSGMHHKNRLHALQALRAMAAAMVVFGHALSTYREKIGDFSDLGLPDGLGGLAVKVFFGISGFIIFTSTTGFAPGFESATSFARRRLIRVVPMYWCATLIYAIKLKFQGAPPNILQLAKSFLFWPYTGDAGLMRPVLGQGWTLNFEIFFYITLAVSLLLKRKSRLFGVAAFLLIVIFAREIGLLVAGDVFSGALFLLANEYLLFFLAGMVIAASPALIDLFSQFNICWDRAGLIVAGLLLTFVTLAPQLKMSATWLIISELVLCTVCILLCVSAASVASVGNSALPQRFIVLAGDGSYSTYLTHGFVMGPAARILSATKFEVSPWLFSSAMVLVCTALGVMIFKFFESPLIAWLNARWGK